MKSESKERKRFSDEAGSVIQQPMTEEQRRKMKENRDKAREDQEAMEKWAEDGFTSPGGER